MRIASVGTAFPAHRHPQAVMTEGLTDIMFSLEFWERPLITTDSSISGIVIVSETDLYREYN